MQCLGDYVYYFQQRQYAHQHVHVRSSALRGNDCRHRTDNRLQWFLLLSVVHARIYASLRQQWKHTQQSLFVQVSVLRKVQLVHKN